MDNKIKKPRGWEVYASPWVVIGSALVLALVVVVIGVINNNHNKRYMINFLKERGAIVINAFEAGARTGMFGMLGQGAEVQTLLEELADRADVLYLVITDKSGRILAHTNRESIGRSFSNWTGPGVVTPDIDKNWRMVENTGSGRAFEVFKEFTPVAPRGRRMGSRMGRSRNHMNQFWCAERNNWPEEAIPGKANEKTYIFVGMDPGPFDMARKHDTEIMLAVTTTLFLLGFGGVVSLFWAQSYRISRSQMLDARALASEIITSLPVGLIVTDRDGRLAYLNDASERIMGLDEKAVPGRAGDDLLPPRLQRLPALLDQGETVLEREMEISFGSGKPVPLSVSVSNIVTEEGSFVGRVFILRDLGEIRRLQAEIQRREKLAALGNMAAGVAHEIRNPLSSIKGYATYFASRFASGSEDQKTARVMAQEVDRLNRVITELLEFARPSELKPVEIEIDTLIDNSLRLIRQDASNMRIKVESSVEDGLSTITVDTDRLSQALLNVYLNAIQSMEHGGRLTVHAGRENGEAFIEIADTGTGIQPENLAKVFDPYFTTKPTGTGLGLAIVHKILEAHQGRIKVDSTPGRGTVMTMFFPIDPETT